MNEMLTSDFSAESYWWSTVQRPPVMQTPLPMQADVVVIGGGVSGLVAARTARRQGGSVCVLDTGEIANGAASRNLGFVVSRVEGAFSAGLGAEVGGLSVVEWADEAREAVGSLLRIIEEIGGNCDLKETGKLTLATNADALSAMQAQVAAYRSQFPYWRETMITKEQMRYEIGGNASRYYVGAKLDPSGLTLNPAKLVVALITACLADNVSVHPFTEVLRLGRTQTKRWEIQTSRGSLTSEHVVVAAMGSAGPVLEAAHRRTFPFLAQVIATEPLEPDEMRGILPSSRGCIDTKQMFYNFRPTPDGLRMIFAAEYLWAGSPRQRAISLRSKLVDLFPSLKTRRVSHCWQGYLAITRDHLPHIASNDNLTWCIAGNVAMAAHLGTIAGGLATGATKSNVRLLRRASPMFPRFPRDPIHLRHVLRVMLNARDLLGQAAPR